MPRDGAAPGHAAPLVRLNSTARGWYGFCNVHGTRTGATAMASMSYLSIIEPLYTTIAVRCASCWPRF